MKKNIFTAVMCFILAAICLALGIIILVTNWGEIILLAIIGVLLLSYVYGYLLLKVALKSKGVVLILTLVEMIVLTAIGVTCVLSEFVNITFLKEGIKILGLALWIRGVVESFRSYFYRGTQNKKYPIYYVVLNVILITAGTAFFLRPFITNTILVKIVAVLFFVATIGLIIFGILKLRKKKAKGTTN